MEWWDGLKYIIDTVQPIYKCLRFADQDKRPNMCELVMTYQTPRLMMAKVSVVHRIRSPRIAARLMMVMIVTVLMLVVVLVVLVVVLVIVVVLVVFVS